MKIILSKLTLKSIFRQEKWIQKCFLYFTGLLIFCIPIEHKYDKIFRRFSSKLIPEGLRLPSHFDKKIYFYFSDILPIVLVIAAIYLYRIPIRRFFLENGTAFLWVIFFSSLASICASPLYHYPLVYTRLLQLLSPILLYLFVVNLSWDKKALRFFLSCLVMAAILQSAFAIAQYFTQEPLGLRLLSESRDAPSTFPMGNGQKWIFDRFFSSAGVAATYIKRSAGTLPHCNILAGFLAISILASYALIATEEKNWKKYGIAGSLILQFFGLITTFSRSAIFGLVLGSFVWFGWAAIQGRLKAYRFLASFIAICAIVSSLCFYNQYLSRGGIINYNLTAQSADLIRINAQESAIALIKKHPIFGVGYQQFSLASPAHTAGVHNIYLFLATEVGIFALIAFMGFIGFILFTILRSPFTEMLASLFAIFITLLFIGGCDFYPLLSHQGKLMLFMTAALIIAEAKRIKGDLKLSGSRSLERG